MDNASPEFVAALRLNNPGTELVGTLLWKTQSGEESGWQFVDNNGTLYGKRISDGLLTKLTEETKEQLDRGLWDFQYKKVVEFDSNEVAAVVLNGENYKNQDGKWVDQKGEEKDFVRSMLIDLEYGSATDLMARDEFSKENLTAKFEVKVDLKNQSQVEFAIFENIQDPTTLHSR